MEKFKLYKIGGCVRDSLLEIPSKDIDYVFVFQDIDKNISAENYFLKMEQHLIKMGVKIHIIKPECFTIRGKFNNEDVDYVMARKETYPNQKTRIPIVEIGTLYDDQMRRDFTINAIAQDENNVLIDPFNGISDIRNKILRCPINAHTSFKDDPLRAIRCLRFALTKTFTISDDCVSSLKEYDMWYKFDKVVSRERVREELSKMFKYNSLLAIEILYKYIPKTYIHKFIFKDDIWLKPTNEKK